MNEIGSIDGPTYLALLHEHAALKAENERLREKVKVQGLNLRLREIDGSMDEDAIIKDAERYRWLRDNPEHKNMPYYEDDKFHIPYLMCDRDGTCVESGRRSFHTLGEAIDTAMEEKEMSKFTRFSPMGDGDIEYFDDGDWCSWDEVEDYVSWTLVSERMPRADTVLKVLVYGAGSGYGVEMATWYPQDPDNFSPFGEENLPMHMITHWMLIPEPPEDA